MGAYADLLQELEQLRREKIQLVAKNAELEYQVNDLDERLKNVFKWEDSSRKQELLTLKMDIATALKLPHGDYQAVAKEPLSQDTYEFSIAVLTQTFRILKRYGITF